MADPYVYRNPSLVLAGTELKCTFNKISLIPTDKMADAETTCAPGLQIPSTTNWMLSIASLLSFGAGPGDEVGFWNLLHPMRKTRRTFVLLPEDAAVSAANPQATFDAYIPSLPFLDSSIGETTRMDVEFSVIGEPAFVLA